METTTKQIVNKVSQKAIVTIDLADFLPHAADIFSIDLKEFLFKELILREADFRTQVEAYDWKKMENKLVALHCSADAIVPMWAYMVITAELASVAKDVACAQPERASEIFFQRAIQKINATDFANQRVVVKGCGDAQIDTPAFVSITQILAPQVRALSYGEPCSMVPVFKQRTH